ncbi:hypothetical protein DRE_02133 [Drechslerella stenobrocha 248]|uniref:Thioredoxin domain-containing protein n=1 Tax=Drechslerella stenobrocha 248 TaxID=1043628 RepID=W7HXW4_9PEZI|nr:hypothetical protein DRE_02133 [Drechslerella stenobrocha 248]
MSAATRDFVSATTLKAEMASLSTPAENPPVGPAVVVGEHFPESPQLPQLQNLDGRPAMVTFLRHCGCPFAEKAFQTFRSLSDAHPDVHFLAISHSTQQDTEDWLISTGGTGDVDITVDPNRTLYATWGLGFSSFWANMGPVTMWKAIKLGQEELIYNRPTKSGYRWQTAGSFAVDADGTVRWAHVSTGAADIADFEAGLCALGRPTVKPKKGEGRRSFS